MSTSQQLTKATSLLSAVDAVRNWRALAMMFASLVAGSLLWGMGALLGGKVHFAVGALFFLFGLAVMFYGGNAVGIMLMDEARGLLPRSPMAAALESLATGHRLILALLLFGLIYLAGLLVLALVLFVCKIPFLGPFLFTFVFPVSVVLVGVAIFALQAVVFPLTAPAIWAGATTLQAVARVGAIARAKVVNVLIMMVVLFLITGLVVALIAGILFGGTLVAGGMAASILGAPLGFGGGFSDILQGGAMEGVSGYMTAGAIGGGVVYAIALSMPGLVFGRGCCDVYLANLEGVDIQAMQTQMQDKMNAALHKAQEMRDQAAQMRAQAPPPATTTPVPAADAPASPAVPVPPFAPVPPPAPLPPPPPPPPPPAPVAPAVVPSAVMSAAAAPTTPAALLCPKCGTPHQTDDLFCGNCGHRLKA
jgi:hypothetical protein